MHIARTPLNQKGSLWEHFKTIIIVDFDASKGAYLCTERNAKNLITFRRGISGKINKKKQQKLPQKRVFKKIGIFGGYS